MTMGNIKATYEVECCLVGCHESMFISDAREYISPAVAVDFIAIIKDRGWSFTTKGWKCPAHAIVDERQIVLPI